MRFSFQIAALQKKHPDVVYFRMLAFLCIWGRSYRALCAVHDQDHHHGDVASGTEQQGDGGQRHSRAALRLTGNGVGKPLEDQHPDQQDNADDHDAEIREIEETEDEIIAEHFQQGEDLRHGVDCDMRNDRRYEGVVLDGQITHEDADHKGEDELRDVLMGKAEDHGACHDAKALADAGQILHQEAAVEQLLRDRSDDAGVNGHEHDALDLSRGAEIRFVCRHARRRKQVRDQYGKPAAGQLQSDGDENIGEHPRRGEILCLEQRRDGDLGDPQSDQCDACIADQIDDQRHGDVGGGIAEVVLKKRTVIARKLRDPAAVDSGDDTIEDADHQHRKDIGQQEVRKHTASGDIAVFPDLLLLHPVGHEGDPAAGDADLRDDVAVVGLIVVEFRFIVKGIVRIDRRCVGLHGSGMPDRGGIPEGAAGEDFLLFVHGFLLLYAVSV